jgi:hypothetical protein
VVEAALLMALALQEALEEAVDIVVAQEALGLLVKALRVGLV